MSAGMSIVRVIRRDLGKQFAVSRNLQESYCKFAKRLLWATLYFAKAVWLGVVAMRRPQLGSSVLCDGVLCRIANWSNSETPTLSGSGFYVKNVAPHRIQYLCNMRELWHRFKFGFSHYTSNWMCIDIQDKLLPARNR